MVNLQTESLYREILYWLQLLADPQETPAKAILQLSLVIALLEYLQQQLSHLCLLGRSHVLNERKEASKESQASLGYSGIEFCNACIIAREAAVSSWIQVQDENPLQ